MIELMMIELSEKQREGASLPGQPAGPACRASLPGQPAGPACRASLPGLSPFRSFKFGQLEWITHLAEERLGCTESYIITALNHCTESRIW
jgi:hypothetical protein